MELWAKAMPVMVRQASRDIGSCRERERERERREGEFCHVGQHGGEERL